MSINTREILTETGKGDGGWLDFNANLLYSVSKAIAFWVFSLTLATFLFKLP